MIRWSNLLYRIRYALERDPGKRAKMEAVIKRDFYGYKTAFIYDLMSKPEYRLGIDHCKEVREHGKVISADESEVSGLFSNSAYQLGFLHGNGGSV